MTRLLLIPLDDTVVFPTMDLTLPIDAADGEQVLLVPRHDGEYASVGTVARVVETMRLPGGVPGAQLEGVARGVAGAARLDAAGHGKARHGGAWQARRGTARRGQARRGRAGAPWSFLQRCQHHVGFDEFAGDRAHF